MDINGHSDYGMRFPYLLLGNKYDIIANIQYFSTLNKSKQILFMYGYCRVSYNSNRTIPKDVINLCHLYSMDENEYKRKVSRDEAIEYANKYHMLYYEVSALSGVKLMEAFEAILLRKKEIDHMPFGRAPIFREKEIDDMHMGRIPYNFSPEHHHDIQPCNNVANLNSATTNINLSNCYCALI